MNKKTFILHIFYNNTRESLELCDIVFFIYNHAKIKYLKKFHHI
jgi:hypothetical protein